MSVTSANRLELLQIAESVAREKLIEPELVIAAMEDSLVYERVDAPVVEYFKRDELEDVQSQFFTAQKSSKRVRVYHSHTCAFVCVSVNFRVNFTFCLSLILISLLLCAEPSNKKFLLFECER